LPPGIDEIFRLLAHYLCWILDEDIQLLALLSIHLLAILAGNVKSLADMKRLMKVAHKMNHQSRRASAEVMVQFPLQGV